MEIIIAMTHSLGKTECSYTTQFKVYVTAHHPKKKKKIKRNQNDVVCHTRVPGLADGQ